jgi:hypothetical protein
MAVVVGSAGFAAAAIASHGHVFRLLTGTTPTSTTMTSTTPGQRRVTICHVTGSRRHPEHTITVAQAAVPAHLRHGDHLGACVPAAGSTVSPGVKPTDPDDQSNGKGHGDDGHGNVGQSTTTTTTGTSTVSTTGSNGEANGHADTAHGNPSASGSSNGKGHADH